MHVMANSILKETNCNVCIEKHLLWISVIGIGIRRMHCSARHFIYFDPCVRRERSIQIKILCFFLTKENTHSVNRKKWCLFETTHTIVNNYNFKHFILIKHFSKRTQLQLNQSMMVMMMNATVGQHFYLHKETNACSWKSHIELIKHMWCSHFADSLHLANSSYSQFLSGGNLILSQFWMISSN